MIDHTDDGIVPLLCCDQCGERIGAAADGTGQWRVGAAGGRVPVVVLHRSCRRAFERIHGGDWAAMDLAVLPTLVREAMTASSPRRRWPR